MTHYNPYPRKQKRKEGKFPIKEKAKRKEKKFPIKEWGKEKKREGRKISNQRKKERKSVTMACVVLTLFLLVYHPSESGLS